jgi:hypothetical protein
MTVTKNISHETVEQSIEAANRQKVAMFLKANHGPAEYRQVHSVQVTENGFSGKITNAPPWNSDVTGTELVFAHEKIQFDDCPFECNEITPPDVVLQCKKHVKSLPTTFSRRSGKNQIKHVAEVILHDFALDDRAAWVALLEYNTRCRPCWSVAELRRFMNQTICNPPKDRIRGHLRSKSFSVQTFNHEG